MKVHLPSSFYDALRGTLFGAAFGQHQINAMTDIATAFHMHGDGDLRKLAYIFATALGEVGKNMEPVRETFAKSDAQAIKNLDAAFAAGKLKSVSKPYWRTGWFGRGYEQRTHEANYLAFEKRSGFKVHKNPSLMLNPAVAAVSIVTGMMSGEYTGKKLADYIHGSKADYKNARRIINGTDRADEFARYAKAFEKALNDVKLTTETKGYAHEPDNAWLDTTQSDGSSWLVRFFRYIFGK